MFPRDYLRILEGCKGQDLLSMSSSSSCNGVWAIFIRVQTLLKNSMSAFSPVSFVMLVLYCIVSKFMLTIVLM